VFIFVLFVGGVVVFLCVGSCCGGCGVGLLLLFKSPYPTSTSSPGVQTNCCRNIWIQWCHEDPTRHMSVRPAATIRSRGLRINDRRIPCISAQPISQSRRFCLSGRIHASIICRASSTRFKVYMSL